MSIYAGFDLGGTQLKYGLVKENGDIVFHDKCDTPPTIEELLQLMGKIWGELKQKHTITAAGFAFPGIFSHKERKILQSPNYAELDNYDIMPALARSIDVPFYLNNDANLAAFGEYKIGAGQGVQSMVLFTIGTGVGSGIILEGKVWQGVCGFGAELGHIIVNPEGERCLCGVQGCLESEVPAPKIVKNYQKFSQIKNTITSEQIAQLAKNGDEAARKAFARAGYYLGIGIGITINFLNPEKILLGGGVMKAGGLLLEPAKREAQKRSYKASFNCCTIEPAVLGNQAGFIGAALWAQQKRSSAQ